MLTDYRTAWARRQEVAALLSETGESLGALIEDRIARFPCSGEINFTVDDAPAAIRRVQ